MPRPKKRKRVSRMTSIMEGNLPERLENLRLRLSSPRLRAAGTIKTYLETAERFLSGVSAAKPTENDLRRYFMRRRQHDISERTLRKEFFHLKKLFQANKWTWPFEREDTPVPEEEAQTVALPLDIIEKLILSRKRYTDRERFYLAVSTTFGNRREEMANIERRNINSESIYIKTAKHGRPRRHPIPPELKNIFDAFHPRKHQPESLSELFKRICGKAGIKPQPGWGWHAIRRTLVTCLTGLLPKNNLDPALIADYMGWAKTNMAQFFGGAAMVGIYRRPEILDNDPYGVDKVVFDIHPFLPLWRDKKPSNRIRKKERDDKSTMR